MVPLLAMRFASMPAPVGAPDGHRPRLNTIKCRLRAGVRALVAAAVAAGCAAGNSAPAEDGNQPAVPPTPNGWNLVWSDEFDGSSLDASKWNIQTGDGTAEGIPGWGNNELQNYQAANVSVFSGNLIITARRENAGGLEYTSGRINTDGKLDIRYGRVEASIHAARGQGMWSAFWMLPTDSAYGTWAAGGEIDIMEVFSRDPTPFAQAALHYGMAWPLNTFKYQKHMEVDPADGFHVYALEWDAQEIRWFVDGTHYYTVRNSTYWNYYLDTATNAHVNGGDSAPFDQPFHLLLNLAVGGYLPGAPTPDALPAELRVDYVRVYECTINTNTGVGCASFADSTGPTVTTPLPDNVYRAVYDLYTDTVGPLAFPNSEDAVALAFGVNDAGGALAFSEVSDGDRGMVIDVNTAGGGNFSIFAANLARQTLYGMGSASDPVDYAGEVQFDLYISGDETDASGSLQVRLDSGFPDLGFVDLPIHTLTRDEWTTITVQISDIAHTPSNFGGGPVDLEQVLSLFVLEPTSHAHLRVDNIRIICGHVGQGDCGILPPPPLPPAAGEPQPAHVAAGAGADPGDATGPAKKEQWHEIESRLAGPVRYGLL
ncbi:MAG: glycoside hydrolase family 16 protein [Gammaproteobacteria bacterium]|nr:glycoside hydrolase family 16 protein [Gammaproteobacteria bacterium]